MKALHVKYWCASILLLLIGCQRKDSATVLPATAVSLIPKLQDFTLNANAINLQAHHSPFSRLAIETDSDTLFLTEESPLYSQVADTSEAGIAVLSKEGKFLRFVRHRSVDTCIDITQGLSADYAIHQYQLLEGTQQRPHDTGPLLGSWLKRVSVPKGYFIRVVHAQAADTAVALIVDSTGSGITLDVPQRDSWPALLRSPSKDIIVDGYGWRSVAKSLGNEEQIADQVARIIASTKHAKRRIAYIQLGTNDRLWSNMSPVAVGQQLGELVEGIHAADASISIKLASPFALKEEGTAPAYRAAIKAVAQAHSYVVYIDGLSLAPSSLLAADGIHWSAAGQVEQAKSLAHVLK